MAASDQRLCHMIKRDDFDGYGFNLHSEKGKPGQYIGKVDEKSPAEEAGLRQGDRIIEVNSVNIGSETHKQVVQRIKAIENEVRLLVIDPDIENRLKLQQASKTNKEGEELEQQQQQQKINNNNSNSSQTPSPSSSLKNQHLLINNNTNQMASSTSSSLSADSTTYAGHDSTTTTPTTTSAVTPTPSQKTIEATPTTPTPTIPTAQNGSTNPNSNGTAKKTTPSSSSIGLNLKMTAAEMRAKLQSKKKYDPKNDTVDLRKKFDIIQKL